MSRPDQPPETPAVATPDQAASAPAPPPPEAPTAPQAAPSAAPEAIPFSQVLRLAKIKKEHLREAAFRLVALVAVLMAFASAAGLWLAKEKNNLLRFREGVELLSAKDSANWEPALETRIGAIYHLDDLARDQPASQPKVMATLAGYLRVNAPLTDPERNDFTLLEQGGPRKQPRLRADLQAALAVLANRNLEQDGPFTLNLTRCDLRGGWLQGASFQQAQLGHTDLRNALLSEARLERAGLALARLQQAELKEAKLQGAVLTQAHLEAADLSGADLRQAQLNQAWLAGAILEGADLRGANLNRAQGISQRQLCLARFDEQTVFPDGAKGRTPKSWCAK